MENINDKSVASAPDNKGIKGNWGIIIIVVALIAVMILAKLVLNILN
ncbi:MAG: hypothetical protein ACOC0C_08035 [Bacteroidota bacterium]